MFKRKSRAKAWVVDHITPNDISTRINQSRTGGAPFGETDDAAPFKLHRSVPLNVVHRPNPHKYVSALFFCLKSHSGVGKTLKCIAVQHKGDIVVDTLK